MFNWLQPRYNLNFYTDKSLDECKNILIENGEKGIKPENNPSNMWLRGHKAPHKSYVIIHDKINSATFQIDVHSPDVMIEFHITGTMTPEKDGTRVRGSSRMTIIEKSALIVVGLQLFAVSILPLLIINAKANMFLIAFAIAGREVQS
ncbi:MAG: hypothetical protein MUE54_10120 [Anaerolineae bacterium]|nr:hypothetical protein [Anaerolineae bacterium]